MSVFMTNDCKFMNCGKCFKTLDDLIRHIETSHLDFSDEVTDRMEQQKLESVPLSYVLKYDCSLKVPEPPEEIDVIEISEEESSKAGEFIDLSSITAYGLNNEEELFLQDSSNNNETLSKDVIKKTRQCIDRPFQCPLPNCSKRYKNVNGIKYHLNNGHKESESSSYKTKYKKERTMKSCVMKPNPPCNNVMNSVGSPMINSSQNLYQLMPESLDNNNYSYSPNTLQNNNDNLYLTNSVTSEYIFPPTVNLNSNANNNSNCSSPNNLMYYDNRVTPNRKIMQRRYQSFY